VCASNTTVTLCGIALPDVLLVSVQGHRKIGTRVSFAVRESALLSVALQVSSQFEPSSSWRIVVAKSVIPLSHLGYLSCRQLDAIVSRVDQAAKRLSGLLLNNPPRVECKDDTCKGCRRRYHYESIPIEVPTNLILEAQGIS
jgi:hypothetical protein